MNELIFMMWLADVVSVSSGMGLLAFGLLALFAGWCAIHFLCTSNNDDCPKPSKILLLAGVTLALTAWLMPSKQTIYAAVALKAGSEIVESRIGQKAVGAIEAILDEVIAKKDKK